MPAAPGRKATTCDGDRRLRLRAEGVVQGVGFRPFLFRLAGDLGLGGWVKNTPQGVLLEVEGPEERLREFTLRIAREAPPGARVRRLESEPVPTTGSRSFQILQSSAAGRRTGLELPDLAVCAECVRELFDPSDRRFRYPFINCTHCGPRFTILRDLPYDRPNTVMAGFEMCAACRAEYEDPRNRRFHAQPNACAACGPQVRLLSATGSVLSHGDAAVQAAASAIRGGAILALKGLGGFQLLVDAVNEDAVGELRRRKCRDEKPFAVMAPSLDWVRRFCRPSAMETALLASPEAPIVLLDRSAGAAPVAPSVCSGSPAIGLMLPTTPLHHLLLELLAAPVVATSGNRADEPLCIDGDVARDRLSGIADLFLDHNRPIERPVDDSVVRVVAGGPLLLRRARGYAPLPIRLDRRGETVLAIGAHLKNSVAISLGDRVFLSQHVGDLESEASRRHQARVAEDLGRLLRAKPAAVACDGHPDYASTRVAERLGEEGGLPLVRVQHHHAHVLACMAENGLRGPVLGVCWDGSGYGRDGTAWGGEFLRVEEGEWTRVGRFRRFPLPGGDAAAREPRRAALGLLFALDPERHWAETAPACAFTSRELQVLRRMLARDVNCPRTSSAGRLFDAVASLLGLRHRSGFEGQAAMALEAAVSLDRAGCAYPIALREADGGRLLEFDWEPTIRSVLDDMDAGATPGEIAARFHAALAGSIVAMARQVGLRDVALTGGCFQNRHLTEEAVRGLRRSGFRVHLHRLVPPNDGGIALGQVVAAALASGGRSI